FVKLVGLIAGKPVAVYWGKGMANPISVTLSSVGVSRAINLDWMSGEAVSVAIKPGASTATSDFTLQYTLDDLQLSSNPTWLSYSSGVGSTAQHFTGATVFDAGVGISFLNPVAGLRLSSTTLSAGSISMDVLQGLSSGRKPCTKS